MRALSAITVAAAAVATDALVSAAIDVSPSNAATPAATPSRPADPATRGAPIAGFTYTSYSAGGYSTNASRVSLGEVAATGVRVIELMATWYVDNVTNATTVYADARASPTDADVLRAAADAAEAGLAVAWKPHIDSKDGVWRANIGTAFTTEAQWEEWFDSYTSFLVHFARLAVASGVPVAGFNVGTELDGTHGRESQWRAVITAVRVVLPGVPLWLGPNWSWRGSPGYEFVRFWDALDFLGVDMYAPLAAHPDPTLPVAIAGWAPLVASLSAFSSAHDNKQFIFAEIGYASYADAAVDAPGCCTGAPDPTTQAVLYASFFEAVWTQPWLGGVFWWAWPENAPGGDPCGTDFSVFAKPAAAIVKAAYGGSVGLGVAPPIAIYADGHTSFGDWSWGATVVLNSTADPYPGHVASAAVTIAGPGALALRAPAPLNVTGLTHLEFDLRAPNASTAFGLSAYLCACDDCGACGPALPSRALDRYAPSTAPCTVPGGWDADPAAARIRIPIADLLPGGPLAPMISRVQIGSNEATSFAVDNIAFT